MSKIEKIWANAMRESFFRKCVHKYSVEYTHLHETWFSEYQFLEPAQVAGVFSPTAHESGHGDELRILLKWWIF